MLKQVAVVALPQVGFLRSSPHDMWSQIVSSCGVCPVHSGMLGNFFGPLTTKFQEQHLFPKTYSHLLVLTTKSDFRPCQHPLLSQVTPNWELLVSRRQSLTALGITLIGSLGNPEKVSRRFLENGVNMVKALEILISNCYIFDSSGSF